jgi:transposase
MIYRAKLTTYKLKKIIECFCLDLTATQTSKLLKINRNTINRYYQIFRQNIYRYQLQEKKRFVGEIEVDESYFGPRRIKGRINKQGRGTTFKQPVFGIFERKGRVYTEIITDCKARTLRKIITGKIDPKSIIYSDSWRGYAGLVDVGYDKHFRINHKKDQFSKGKVHVNGIESFWSFTKRRLTRFNGVKRYFHLHLKECEWRWNKKEHQQMTELLQIIKFLKS